MLAAIKELADRTSEESQEHLATLKYLEECSLLFEDGILSNSVSVRNHQLYLAI
jgi:hypothetical protein